MKRLLFERALFSIVPPRFNCERQEDTYDNSDSLYRQALPRDFFITGYQRTTRLPTSALWSLADLLGHSSLMPDFGRKTDIRIGTFHEI